jgi:FkbM family methyltransferase
MGQRFVGSLSKGMTVIDVGANVGYYTLVAARVVGPKGTVHAIEPCDTNLAFLTRNLRLSGLRNVQLHACAADAKRARRSFHVTDSAFDHGFYSHPIAKTTRETAVDTVPVDDLVQSPVHVVKIDVEGAEIDVLNGMTRIMRENTHLSLFVEWSPWCMRQAGREAGELPERLREFGFRDICVVDDLAGRERSIEDVLQTLRNMPTPHAWYAMIHARK